MRTTKSLWEKQLEYGKVSERAYGRQLKWLFFCSALRGKRITGLDNLINFWIFSWVFILHILASPLPSSFSAAKVFFPLSDIIFVCVSSFCLRLSLRVDRRWRWLRGLSWIIKKQWRRRGEGERKEGGEKAVTSANKVRTIWIDSC